MNRLTSIDIVRALTMVLMIFVNDLWSLTDIPTWLEHVERGVDGLGLADVVFPAFLFIVGLSIPFALKNRRKKGENDFQLLQHVGWRTVALLMMGVFLVNGESINAAGTGMHRLVWNTICCSCFILIWNDYPATMRRQWVVLMKSIGIIVLFVLAFIYRGGSDDDLKMFAPQWWGILGLIGWAYLGAALVAVFSHDKLWINVIGWIFFTVLSMAWQAGMVPQALHFIPEPLIGGTLAGLVSGGVCTSLIVQHYRAQKAERRMLLILAAIAGLMFLFTVITRPYWGISKLGATPAWMFICSGFTIVGLIVVYVTTDMKGRSSWFEIVKPAGTDTLLCYLIPYYAYAVMALGLLHVPEFALSGVAGLIKSFLFALLCVQVTRLLSRWGIRLKL